MATAPDLTPQENERIREVIKAILKLNGATQQDVALTLEVSPAAVSGLLKGTSGASFGLARRLAKYLKTDVMSLLGMYPEPEMAVEWPELLSMVRDSLRGLKSADNMAIEQARDVVESAWDTVLATDPILKGIKRYRNAKPGNRLEGMQLASVLEEIWMHAPVSGDVKERIAAGDLPPSLEMSYEEGMRVPPGPSALPARVRRKTQEARPKVKKSSRPTKT